MNTLVFILAQAASGGDFPWDWAVIALFGLIFVVVILLSLRPQHTDAVSHWYQLVDGLQYSTKSFYDDLGKELDEWKIPRAKISRVEHSEGYSFVSAKRLYLRVQREELFFEVCGAEFGRGFFVSWWLVDPSHWLDRVAGIPVVGYPLRPFVRRLTYYRIDTQIMFQEVVRNAVLKVLDELIKTNNLKELSEQQRKPIMREFLKR